MRVRGDRLHHPLMDPDKVMSHAARDNASAAVPFGLLFSPPVRTGKKNVSVAGQKTAPVARWHAWISLSTAAMAGGQKAGSLRALLPVR